MNALHSAHTNSEMPDIVLTHNDEEITVDLDSITMPEGFRVITDTDFDSFVPKATVKSDYVPKDEFKRRLKGVKDNAHDDATVIARVLESHKTEAPDEDALKQRWDDAYLRPALEELAGFKEGIKNLKVREAASHFFSEAFVTPLGDDQPSPAEIAFGKKFQFDGSETFAVDSDGEPLLPVTSDTGRKRRSVSEHMAKLAEDPQFEGWLKVEPKGGGGSGNKNNIKGEKDAGTPRLSSMSEADQIAYGKEHGFDKLTSLKE